jgi:UDP-N-acetylmuramoyl-tripeptide--D-alanyl-D-alanine ligase
MLLVVANAVTSVFENARNAKFIKKAEQVLAQTDTIKIAVVGSYGKTSVKNILATILKEKYEVLATPESYNTQMGVAKTIMQMQKKPQIFIAEMGARKQGDIAELCKMVKPDYAIFTGVCPQHIATFKNIQSVYAEKSEIIKCGAKTVCGANLKDWLGNEENAFLVDENAVRDINLQATKTQFVLDLDGEALQVETTLLSYSAVENIQLVATLCKMLGMTVTEIAQGIKKLQPVPHRLQLTQNNGVYILDDGYNANIKGAKEALQTLARFEGRKCVVTPGLVECGVLEEELGLELGKAIALAGLDKVILVGETLVGAVKNGYVSAGGAQDNLTIVKSLAQAQETLKAWVQTGDCVLFLNDLPDVY